MPDAASSRTRAAGLCPVASPHPLRVHLLRRRLARATDKFASRRIGRAAALSIRGACRPGLAAPELAEIFAGLGALKRAGGSGSARRAAYRYRLDSRPDYRAA